MDIKRGREPAVTVMTANDYELLLGSAELQTTGALEYYAALVENSHTERQKIRRIHREIQTAFELGTVNDGQVVEYAIEGNDANVVIRAVQTFVEGMIADPKAMEFGGTAVNYGLSQLATPDIA